MKQASAGLTRGGQWRSHKRKLESWLKPQLTIASACLDNNILFANTQPQQGRSWPFYNGSCRFVLSTRMGTNFDVGLGSSMRKHNVLYIGHAIPHPRSTSGKKNNIVLLLSKVAKGRFDANWT